MSDIEETTRLLAEQFGADAAIEIQAQAFDAIIPGLGEALRLAWELCMACGAPVVEPGDIIREDEPL